MPSNPDERQNPDSDALLEQQLAPLLQKALIAFQVGIVALLAANMLMGNVPPSVNILLPNVLLIIMLFASLMLLRRGYVKPSLWVLVGILLAVEGILLFQRDLSIADRTLIIFVIPVSLAGLFLGRAMLLLVTAISIVMVWLSAGLSTGVLAATTAVQYTAIIAVYALLVDTFRGLFYRALLVGVTQARALEKIQIDNINLYHKAEHDREQLHVTLASIGDGVIATDTQARITFLNPVAERLTGWTQAQATGQPLMDVFRIVNEQTGLPVDNPVERTLLEGIVVGLANHTELIALDGRRIPIADSAAPIRNAQGRMIGAVLVFRDVQQERQAQIALEESEARFRNLADSAPGLIWMSDETGNCTYFNKVWLDFTGRPFGDQLGMGWSDGVHPDDRERCLKTYQDAFASRLPFQMDYRLCRADGVFRWVADVGVPRFSSDGMFLGFVGSCIDVSERKQQERQTRLLQQVTSKFSEALTPQQVADVVIESVMGLLGSRTSTLYSLNADGVLEVLSQKGVNEIDLSRYHTLTLDASGPLLDAIRSREAVWISTLEEYKRRYPDFADIAQKHGNQSITCIPLIVNDQVLGGFTLSFPTPMQFEPGVMEFILSIGQQCAQALDRARLYESEAQARRQAEESDRLKLKFLAMISHELRTPLTSIKGFSSTLLAPDVDWEREIQLEFLSILDMEADKLTELVEHLLDVSRLQAGNLSISTSVQSFNHILDSVDNELRRLAHDHVLQVFAPDDLPLIDADGRRVAQVLSNLVGNAVKYSPSGTAIRVDAQRDGNVLRVTVTDEGIGIPPEQRENAFEAFQQLEQRRNGAGLGLAICRGLIEAHGGHIWIADHAAPGTQVMFTLPVSESVGQERHSQTVH
jgi:PAS domain S-box-containing protein